MDEDFLDDASAYFCNIRPRGRFIIAKKSYIRIQEMEIALRSGPEIIGLSAEVRRSIVDDHIFTMIHLTSDEKIIIEFDMKKLKAAMCLILLSGEDEEEKKK
jgi:hypothetical protein